MNVCASTRSLPAVLPPLLLLSPLSLVPLLRTPTSPSPTRRTVYSGLANFRTVIHTFNVTHQLELICQCLGKPSAATIAKIQSAEIQDFVREIPDVPRVQLREHLRRGVRGAECAECAACSPPTVNYI